MGQIVMTDEFLDAALVYASWGWAVFPLQQREKRPHAGTHGFWDATTAEPRLREFWRRWPQSNVGVATGASGLLVLDVDSEAGEAALATLTEAPDHPLPRTLEQRTGKGRQMIYRRPEGSMIGNSAGKLGPSLDVRGQGGYIVAAPSVHPNGRAYEWVVDAVVADAPTWLVSMLEPPPPPERTVVVPKAYRGTASAYAHRALDRELSALGSAPEGQRNATLNTAAFSLGQLVGGGELSETHVTGALRLVALSTGLDEHEVDATIRSGMSAGERQPRTAPR